MKSFLNDLPDAIASTTTHRSSLVQKTKEFRAISDASLRLKSLPSLIKNYQQHIDVIKTRAENAEQRLQQLEPILTVPDQTELLQTKQKELQETQTKLDELNLEFQSAKLNYEKELNQFNLELKNLKQGNTKY